MKKLYLPYLLLLMPFFGLAQNLPPMLKDAWKKVPGIVAGFKLNDHVGIMQVTLNDTSFEIMAVDNKVAVLWRDTLIGYGVACGKFKGNILAISDSAYSNRKGNINPYYASLVDPASGKIILQKKIFDQKARHDEQATAFFAPDGSIFNLMVLQADVNNGWLGPYKNKIEDLTLISLNEKLEPAYVKPNVPDEDFVNLAMNNSGDLFLTTIRDQRTLQVRRYEHGSSQPSEPLTQVCDDVDKQDLRDAANGFVPSEADRNIVYLCIGHNNKDDDREIITAKINFATQKVQTIGEVFTHKHVKDVEKSYVPANDYFMQAHLGSAKKQMRVQYAAAIDGKFVTVTAEIFWVTLNNTTTFYGNGLVITCFDAELKQLFQQIMPVNYTVYTPLNTGYSPSTNQLNIVSNLDYAAVFGQLDLSTGKWLKLVPLTSNGGYSDQHVIWLNDNFIVPYRRSRFFGSKVNVDLVLNNY